MLGVTWFARRLARRARPLRAARRSATAIAQGRLLRRGRVGQGRLRADRAALGRGARGQRGRRRRRPETVNDDPYGAGWLVRIALADPAEADALLDAAAYRELLADAVSYISLTARRPRGDARGDRRRLGRGALRATSRPASASSGELDVPPALAEADLHAPPRASSPRRNVVDEVSFLGAGIYDHYVPAVVDAVLAARRVPHRLHALPARALPGRPAGDLRVPDGDLRADRDGRLERLRLRRHDGRRRRLLTSPRAATGRSRVVITEATNPQVRAVVKTFARGFGLEVVEVPHEGGTTDPERVARGRRRRGGGHLPAAELLRLPRAGARARGRRERRRAPCRSPTST